MAPQYTGIQVENLSIGYQGHVLFQQAGFTLQQGEKCGLVGRNGSGKSTLFRLLAGKEPADTGSVIIRKNYTIGVLDQHIRFTKPTLVEEACLGLRPGDEDCLYKVEKVLFGLGFKQEELDADPSVFSGGYQLRLHLAKILISEPDCLLLDEPTNYLDIVSIRWFMRFLQQWRGEFILISHDREFMDAVTTHTMGIHRHKLHKVKSGTVAFYEQILQEEEIHERTRLNLEKKKANMQAFIDRFGAKATKATQAQSKQKMLDRIPTLERLKDLEGLSFNFNEAPFHSKKMMSAENVDFSYEESASLIHDFSIDIEKGERIAIVGKNGRGKSTLLKLFAQELAANNGKIKISENVKIGYFGQTNIDRLHPLHTIEEEISTANPQMTTTQLRGICGLMMFSGDKAEKRTQVLSGGEKSRVLLGKIIASPCNVLLLDEPTHHLDMESIEALIDALEEFDGTVILVTHSELILKRLELSKIVVCQEGRQQLFLGSYQDFLEKDGWGDSEERAKKKEGSSGDSRKKRADIMNNRSKSIKPLERTIEAKEARVTSLEVALQKAQEKILEASENQCGQTIQNISKQITQYQAEIDIIFAELVELHQQKDVLIEKFDKELEGL